MLIEMAKTIIVKIIHGILRLLFLFPPRGNRVVIVPSNGHYYCNLKYVDQELRREGLPLEVIWISKGEDASYPADVRRISMRSWAFLYYFCTARVILFNDCLPLWLTKRKGQVFINTWHGGGAYKRMAAVFIANPNCWYKMRFYYIFNRIDYMVSASRRTTEGYEMDIGIPTKYLPIGMPRNDLFFDRKKMAEKSALVRAHYGVGEDVGIVLYAPTFRDNGIKLDLNGSCLLAALEQRFHKKFILFVRSHPHRAKDIFTNTQSGVNEVDVSGYADMQELLAAADVLITDYSSSIWDFSFTGRPCFIYANDIASYKEERDFYIPIDKWGFPLAENNEELERNISAFDEEDYRRKAEAHQKSLGSYETGHASEALCRLIDTLCRKS